MSQWHYRLVSWYKGTKTEFILNFARAQGVSNLLDWACSYSRKNTAPVSCNRGQPGFSLIELLVSLLILAIGIIGTMAMLPQAYRGITTAGRVSTINHLGYQKIDELRTLAKANWGHTDLVGVDHPATPAARMVGSGFPDYSITWKVLDDTPSGEVGEIRTIIVEVGYLLYNSSGNPITHEKALRKRFQTLIAE